MKIGLIISMFAIFTSVFAGSMFIVNNTVKVELHNLGDSLRADIERKVETYQNVYTADEIINLVNEAHRKDIEDLKKLIKEGNKKQTKDFKYYMNTERMKYDTIYFEDNKGIKFLLVGKLLKNNFYLLSEEEVDKFPFE